MHRAICHELELKKKDSKKDIIQTVYFGGGTPSIFSSTQLLKILETIHKNYTVSAIAEITLEANPDDLNKIKLKQFHSIGINRLSIGVQTFDDSRLQYINRLHTSNEAKQSVLNAFEVGFENLTCDLIYAIPPSNMAYWQNDLDEMINLGVPHISIYGLTIEDKTVFGNWKVKGKLVETDEDIAANQYKMAIEQLTKTGLRQYEVSNFAKPGFESKHNGAYWSGEKYIGIGPGAHSFNTVTRSHNIANNIKYIDSINNGIIPESAENLSKNQKMNEYILTRLRTTEGISFKAFTDDFRTSFAKDKSSQIIKLIEDGLVKKENNKMCLTTDGYMVADEIALQLFYEEE